MPYRQITGDLVAMFDAEARRAVRSAARKMTDQAGREMTERTRELTPKQTGRTAESFGQIEVHRDGPDGYVSGVESSYYLARLLNDGVAPHDLRPKRERGDGEPIEHPGFAGHHMVEAAAAEIEETLPQIVSGTLGDLSRTIEALASMERWRRPL